MVRKTIVGLGALIMLLALLMMGDAGRSKHVPALAAYGTNLSETEAPANAPVAGLAGRIWYVSKRGSNQDGGSWATAWNELNQINWNVVSPGDTVLLDGGAPEMVYTSSLMVTKSGVSAAPITIRVADAPGRNGKVVIFGGRPTPLPYCDQTGYVYPTSGVRDYGIVVDQRAWVVIDGLTWGGIKVYGHNRSGVILRGTSNHITLRNLEVYDNGRASQSNGRWYPDLPGVNLSGTDITFERVLIHDNGQDAIQSGGGVGRITIRSSWLYQSRRHPVEDEAFNNCRHPDGVQIFDGGDQYGFLIEDSIIGPGWMQGLYLGSSPHTVNGELQWATIHDVTLRHTLFYDAYNANIMSAYESQYLPRNWRLENVTSHRIEAGRWHNLYMQGSGHTIVNSIFQGSSLTLPNTQFQASGNCQWQTIGGVLGQLVGPRFVNPAQGDFGLQPDSPCAGKGSRITSPAVLLSGAPAPPTLAPSPATATPPAATPTPQPPLPPTGSTLPGLTWEAEQGVISPPFSVTAGAVSQSVETNSPAHGGRATYRFRVWAPGSYIIKMRVDAPGSTADSVFVNIDAEPTSPTMIWDIGATNSFEDKTVSWRGAGSADQNEFVPKQFSLSVGEHELVIRGREPLVRLDRITVIPHALTCYDFNGNGTVDTLDVMAVGQRWQLTAVNPDPDNNLATPNYEPQYDIILDGRIDSLDTNAASLQWGRRCR